MRVLTLTMNPAIDKGSEVGQVVPDRKLRCEAPTYEPGGGGINVSRALRRLGTDALALYPAGGPPGEIMRQLLEREGITQRPVPISEWTRENLMVFESSTGNQYRFGMPGASLSERELNDLRDVLAGFAADARYLVVSGSLPPNVPDEFYAGIAIDGRERNVRVVADCSGTALEKVVDAGPYLVKPNLVELEQLAGHRLEQESDQEAAARDVIRRTPTQVVVVSLGPGGALLATADDCVRLRAPTVRVRSRIGAGDSMVAGIVLGLTRDYSVLEAARFGVAAGTAAVMTEGTQLCRQQDVEALYESMRAGSGSDRH